MWKNKCMDMKWNACNKHPNFITFKRVSSFVKKKKKSIFIYKMKEEKKTNLPIVDQNHWSEEIEWNEWIENGSNKYLLPKICYTHHRFVIPFQAEPGMN